MYINVFVIDPRIADYRYLLTGGRIMDVQSPYGGDSSDRAAVLVEAQRRWGGKKDDWRIEGVTVIPSLSEVWDNIVRQHDEQPSSDVGPMPQARRPRTKRPSST